MSRVGCCIDNGPMEGFWGIIKREIYYGRKFTSREVLVQAITDYIDYYNNRRYQRRLFTTCSNGGIQATHGRIKKTAIPYTDMAIFITYSLYYFLCPT